MENAKANALRPSMPSEPDAQLRWLIARQTDALVQVAAAAQRLTDAVTALERVVSVMLAREPAE